MNRYPTLSLIVIAVLFLGLFLSLRESRQSYWDFRNNVWAVARLVLEGKAPEEEPNLTQLSSLIGEPLARGIWSPTVTLLTLPFGVMDWQSAGALWLILNIIAVWALVLMSARGRQSVAILVVIIGMVVVFPPTLSVLMLGQVSLLMTVINLLALRALARRHPKRRRNPARPAPQA